jgi:glutathione S-transferase
MRFYDYPLAPSPRKVRLFIAEKSLSIPTVEVDLRARAQLTPDFLAKNPGATVPVLELDDGTAIWDSKRIVEWARENPAA